MKNFRDYLSESEEAADTPVVGDNFAINIREECLIESVVVESRRDGVVIAADQRMMQLLESYGYSFEQTCMECGGSGCGCGQSADEYGDETDVGQDPGEYDQEGDMAKDELMTMIRSARRLIGMLDTDDNMPEWTQKKINKATDYVDTAADYISSKKERGVMEQGVALPDIRGLGPDAQSLILKLRRDVEDKRLQPTPQAVLAAASELAGDMDFAPELLVRQVLGNAKGIAEGDSESNPVARATLHRIMMRHPGMLAQHGPERVMAAVDDVADLVGDMDDIGTSDISGWVNMVKEILDSQGQGVAEQGSFSQTPAQKQYGVLHSKLKSLADSGQIDTPVGKQKAEQIIDAIQQLVDTKLSGSTVPSKKIWLSTQGVAEGSQGFNKIKTSYDQAGRLFSGEETQGFTIEVLLPNEATFKKIQDTFEMFKNQIGEYLIEKDDSIEGNGIGVVIISPLKQGGQNAQRSYNQILDLIKKSRGQFNHSTGVTIYKRPQGVAEGAEQLHPETLELIDEYISKIEPDADRDEMIQSVIRGSIHPSELEYALKDDVAEAEYQGRKVPLGKPMRGDVAKSKVYVRDPKTGNIKKVNFGDPNMKIKKSNPARRKSFRARHNCDNPGPRTSARYWSCRAW